QAVGHAIELRINAEDPGRGFLPTPGRIDVLDVPGGPGVRWDAGVRAGDTVQPAFDSLFAKLIVSGPDRHAAIARTITAAKELNVEGRPRCCRALSRSFAMRRSPGSAPEVSRASTRSGSRPN